MELTIPHYYRRFRCIASECPDTCCAGWEIVIDDRTLNRYRKIRGPFGKRVRASIDWKKKIFRQKDRRCAFLNRDNLCDLCLEQGSESLCRTCRLYPRHIEEFEDCRELSLSLSCMAAARIILGTDEKVRFLHREVSTSHEEDYKSFDYFLFTNLLDVRDTLFGILQNRTVDAGTRSCMALSLAHDFQGRISGRRLGETQELLERYRNPGAAGRFRNDMDQYRSGFRRETALRVFCLLKEMEVLQKDWPEELWNARRILYGRKESSYRELKAEWRQNCRDNGVDLENLREQLMVYYTYTYFAGAVYDARAYGKLKLAAALSFLTEELTAARWKYLKKPMTLDLSQWTAHRLSKEIEHSDRNLTRLESLLTPVGLTELFGLLL